MTTSPTETTRRAEDAVVMAEPRPRRPSTGYARAGHRPGEREALVGIIVRLPAGMHARLKEIAEWEKRSLVAQVEVVLRDFLARYDREHPQQAG